ncbi:alpha-L-rhamnosidase [Schaalia vaccimaxillae]|uniref:alpha-L-rhamnosidase n=1 Tax=Schaalia vaccimaxillae TaxID=183916 RepID=UPI0003B4AE1F|nr:alpha-L-rhamnosidase [Schaalia vaccimaxillae]
MNLPTEESSDHTVHIESLTSRFNESLIGTPLAPTGLTWTVNATSGSTHQVGYQIRHRSNDSEWTLEEPIASAQSLDVAAPAGTFIARERRDYSVRIATEQGWSNWSDPLRIEAGLDTKSLTARVIGIDSELEGPTAILRKTFSLDFTPVRARLYLSALGLVSPRINGEAASDAHLTPGWTEYDTRILVDTYDVTDLIHVGDNAISLTVADGWYRGRMGFASRTEIYGDRSGAIAQLEIFAEDGSSVTIETDESWTGGFGQIRSASIYDGSLIDLRIDGADASTPEFDDTQWMPVQIIDQDLSVFEPRPTPPVRVVDEFDMHVLSGDPKDASQPVVLDATQNISGWVALTVKGAPGAQVVVRHAEVLEPDGSLHTASLRSAKATDTYILGEDGEVTLEPAFTFHGFRYADVTGPVEIVSATAVAISSDLTRRALFSSSHATLDRFHENVVWSQLDNFVSIPTDCPQRDERLGWTGDAQAFAATANTLFDAESFWASWMRDVEISQDEDGAVASLVPNILTDDVSMGGEKINHMGRAGWADAATIVPWSTYVSTGSTRILSDQLDSMRRWVDHLKNRAGHEVLLPEEPFQYGDWLDPDAPAAQPWNAKTPALFVANCFYVESARILARAEKILGNEDEAQAREELANRVADAVWQRWSQDAHRTQTGAAMCLEFGIVPVAERAALVESLADEVRREKGRIATGFLGTPLVLFALSHSGKWEEAYMMLLRRDAPSWLYQVDRGATTVWERWDAIKPDGSIHAGEMEDDEGGMISFNHYAYGAVIDWVYRNVAGLEPVEPGYRTVRVGPRPSSALTQAKAAIDTGYGALAIDWKVQETGDLEVALTVPFGVTAMLDLPVTAESTVCVNGDEAPESVSHGEYRITVTKPSVVEVNAPAS